LGVLGSVRVVLLPVEQTDLGLLRGSQGALG